MCRAALQQKLKDLILVSAIVILTGCAADPLDVGEGQVMREPARQGAQAQQQARDEGVEAPIRKRPPKLSSRE